MAQETPQKDKKDEDKLNPNTVPPTPVNTAPPAIEAIEEDDEFEEFEPCNWDTTDEDAEDAQQWQVSRFRLFLESRWNLFGNCAVQKTLFQMT